MDSRPQFGGGVDQMPDFFMLGADGYMIDCNGVTTHIHLSFYVVWRIVDLYRYI